MKKVIFFMCAILISSMSFAQKNEIKALEKALKNSDFANAKAAASSADALIANMDDKTKAKFYYLKAQALYANGSGNDADLDASIKTLDELKSFESKMGKLKYTENANEMKASMLQNVLTKADAALKTEDYLLASKGFEKAYRLSTKDTSYLFYAASTAVNAKDYKSSLRQYIELKGLGYTGKQKVFYATNVETSKEESFSSKNARDIGVKTKVYDKPRSEVSDSKYSEIIKNIALIYVAENENEKAIAAMLDARKENPDDLDLLLTEANVHLKMGNKDKFKQMMQQATEMDPENPELQYNLGVIAAESGDNDEAKAFYEKAITLDPNYVNAYTNIAVVILAKETSIVEEMNGLGSSSKDNLRYDELKDKRTELYKQAIPYLEKALSFDDNNYEAATTLMNIYSAVGDMDKFKAIKEKIANMPGKN